MQHSMVNPLATVLLERINPPIAFVGCNGFDISAGITNVNLPEAEIKRSIVLAGRRRVVVADGSKLGSVAVAKVCDLSEVDLVITEHTADPATVARVVAGCEVDVASNGP